MYSSLHSLLDSIHYSRSNEPVFCTCHIVLITTLENVQLGVVSVAAISDMLVRAAISDMLIRAAISDMLVRAAISDMLIRAAISDMLIRAAISDLPTRVATTCLLE
jgi:hypothetical protein